MIWDKYKFKTEGTWLKKVFNMRLKRKKFNLKKCMSQYIRIMSLKMRWVWIWAIFDIQTKYATVFCGTNLLSLDEIQVNGEGDGNTDMLEFSDICSDSDDSEVVREDISDHSLGGLFSKVLKKWEKRLYFSGSQVKQIKFIILQGLIRISSGWY